VTAALGMQHAKLVWFFNIFPIYPINGTIFWGGNQLNIICVLISSKTFVRNISYSKKSSARYYHKCVQAFMKSAGYSCQIVTKVDL
jgi:hypothetical protein